MSGEDVKTMIGGRITPEGVKTVIKGNVLDIIGAVRIVLDEMSEIEKRMSIVLSNYYFSYIIYYSRTHILIMYYIYT